MRNKITYKRVLPHLAYWIVFILYIAFFSGYPNHIGEKIVSLLIQLPFDLFVVYFSLYFLIPRFLVREKYLIFSLLYLSTCFLFVALQRTYYYELIEPELGDSFNYWQLKDVLQTFLINWAFYTSAVVVKVVKVWYQKKIEVISLQNQQNETLLRLKDAELLLLRSQIHPHFLFNILNNLYGLIIAKSDLAPEMVIRISKILDYMLYRCNSEKVSLKGELEYIKDYIELERIRHKDIKLDFEEEGISENDVIAPLLLLPFIENSFKHGAANQSDESWINIKFRVIGKNLYFNISNSVLVDENIKNPKRSKGIGLSNIKKRLDLLYNEKYKLEIDKTDKTFSVRLLLEL